MTNVCPDSGTTSCKNVVCPRRQKKKVIHNTVHYCAIKNFLRLTSAQKRDAIRIVKAVKCKLSIAFGKLRNAFDFKAYFEILEVGELR